jgi:hypothetical protein
MKPRLITLIGLALAYLALAGFALRSPQEAASRASEAVAAGGHYYLLSGAASQSEATTLSGGRYQLTFLLQNQTQDLASGGRYRLVTDTAPTGSENGCCCMFLPCVRR